MSAHPFVAQLARRSRFDLLIVFAVLAASVTACSDDSDGSDDAAAGRAGQLGQSAGENAGGAPSAGASGASASGRSNGGRAGAEAGTSGTRAGAAGRASAGGSQGGGGQGGAVAGSGGTRVPPDPRPDGMSPYLTECHGNSLDCNDPALRCLGLRDATTVFGYSCSNQCQTVDDCSTADSGAEATVGCVDFVSNKHCLFVCKDEQNGDRDCPAGMSCYVYPGALIGYCLWQ